MSLRRMYSFFGPARGPMLGDATNPLAACPFEAWVTLIEPQIGVERAIVLFTQSLQASGASCPSPSSSVPGERLI